MKTNIISILTILSSTFAFGQVGINTQTPRSTLDVVGKIDTTTPDGVLIPRFTAAQLSAKDAVYTAAQNGTLVFVISGTGITGGKTENITGAGFYYYDSTSQRWIAVGGGSTLNPQRYETIRGTRKILTSTAPYTAAADDFFIITKASGALTIDLPDPAGNIGRLIYIVNNNTSAGTVTVTSAGGATLLTGTLNQNRGKAFISDGTAWTAISFS